MKSSRWLAGLAVALCAASTQAQQFPSKPIRIIVGFVPGGATDIIARSIAPPLGESLGQTVIVDNRPGASSQIAGMAVAKSPPDGHTLMMMTQTLMTSQMIEGKTYPDVLKDFAHVALTATSTLILVVNPSFPVKSLKDLIALARARPGEINYASGGVGTTPHLSGELLATMAKLKVVHVPYKGEAPGLTDVMGGHVPFMFSNVTASLAFVKAGKLRAIALGGTKRSPAVPDLPLVAETLPGFQTITWYALIGPRGIPAPIVSRLNAEIYKMFGDPAFSKRVTDMGQEPQPSSPAELHAHMRAENERWSKVIKMAGLKPLDR